MFGKAVSRVHAQKPPITSVAAHLRVPILATSSHNQFINVSMFRVLCMMVCCLGVGRAKRGSAVPCLQSTNDE